MKGTQMIEINTPCTTCPLPSDSSYYQIKDCLGGVIAICNDASTADQIKDHLNSPVVDSDEVQSAVLEKAFA